MDDRYAATPAVPEEPIIVTGMTAAGEPMVVAFGFCVCSEERDAGQFWLRAGEQWVCPVCERTYRFDGTRLDRAEPDHI